MCAAAAVAVLALGVALGAARAGDVRADGAISLDVSLPLGSVARAGAWTPVRVVG